MALRTESIFLPCREIIETYWNVNDDVKYPCIPVNVK